MNMFKPTAATTPAEYIAALPEPRRHDVETIHKLIQKTLPELKPLIRSGMIGYGTYHYRYESGREGDWSLVMLASQKNYISLYICAVENGKYIAEEYKDKLPEANIGKSCIRFKSAADIDLSILTEIMKRAEKVGGAGQV
jgi:uncharacterized protein YdhG (YjbR/CyaY superfamily)